jgi:hypothetical protein
VPRLDHQVQVQTVLSYETEMVLRLVLDQLNVLRQRAGLAALTEEQVRQAVKAYLQTHPRQGAP